MHKIKRFLPLIILLSIGVFGYFAGLHEYLTFEALHEHREALQQFVSDHTFWAAISFVVIYSVAVAVSVPGASFMTVAGGFLFGTLLGGGLVVIAATAGATVIFMVARSVVGQGLRKQAGPFLQKMESGFRDNALNYLLFLRLVPVFPFWVVNLVPGVSGVPLRVFVIATAIGIIPGTFVFSAFGAGLGDVLDSGENVTLSGVLSPTLIAAFVGLGFLALLPVILKKGHKA